MLPPPSTLNRGFGRDRLIINARQKGRGEKGFRFQFGELTFCVCSTLLCSTAVPSLGAKNARGGASTCMCLTGGRETVEVSIRRNFEITSICRLRLRLQSNRQSVAGTGPVKTLIHTMQAQPLERVHRGLEKRDGHTNVDQENDCGRTRCDTAGTRDRNVLCQVSRLAIFQDRFGHGAESKT